MSIKAFKISVGKCAKCDSQFLYVYGKVNSISSHSSELYGSPVCPTCHSFRNSSNAGTLKIDKYHIEDRNGARVES